MTAATFTGCALPGCSEVVAEPGDVCPACQFAFGDMLRPTSRPIDLKSLAARDESTRQAYRAQAVTAAERKPMQLCWLCEQRRTCTRTSLGWECDDCHEVTG